MNLPNKLTVMRLILSLIIIAILCIPFYSLGLEIPEGPTISGITLKIDYMIAGIIFIIASLTDFLDGHIARKRGLVTNTGKMLDAIADKVLVNSVLIILAAKGEINAIIPVIIVVRDIIVNAIKMQAASRGKVVAAIGSGKLKTATLMVGVVLVFFGNMPFEIWSLNIADFLLYLATILSIVSMIQYYNLNKSLIFDENSK
ncbi:MAG: CDP-diacylglycerol--glycerol-3-phosphate 3-phosphatidyltransferase [Bacilli bacterium]|nr:CDP-diacylglycerol--glycerol-3-phosphate 3-phosphatidyltransferase [Bacilli bacterium]